MKEKFENYLKLKNIKCESIGSNTLVFQNGNLHYAFQWDEDAYFRIILPNIDKSDDNTLRIAREIERDFKVVKIIDVNDDLWIVAESFVASAEILDNLFEIFLNLTQAVFNYYRNEKSKGQQ